MSSAYQRGGRGLGGKRVSRFSISLSNFNDDKLKKLAISCDMPKSTLASMLIEIALNSPDLVYVLQEKYNKNPNYRIIPVKQNGMVHF